MLSHSNAMHIRAAVAAITLILFLTACSSDKPQEPVTLKVATYSPKNFERDYGLAFREANPHIRLEYTELQDGLDAASAILEWMNEEQPDLIVSGQYLHNKLIESEAVLPLDALAQQHGYDLASYPASLLDSLKRDGTLYAIASDINSLALFYNKSILDRYRIDYPADGMPWSRLIELAGAVPEADEDGTNQYGLVSVGKTAAEQRLFQMIEHAGRTEGLRPLDMNARAGTLQTQSWSDIWHAVIEGYQSGAIDLVPLIEDDILPFEGTISTERYRPFLNGEAALILAHSDLLPLLRKDDAMKDWGVAAPPGTYQAFLQPANLFSIAKQSPVHEEAWQLLAFVNSDAMAKQKAALTNQYTGMIPAKVSIPESSWKLDLTPFYEQKVIPDGIYMYADIPAEWYTYYAEQAVKGIADVLEGRQTIDDALASLNTELTAEMSKR
jgi:multiple sugar transport system substrate-binding protein